MLYMQKEKILFNVATVKMFLCFSLEVNSKIPAELNGL